MNSIKHVFFFLGLLMAVMVIFPLTAYDFYHFRDLYMDEAGKGLCNAVEEEALRLDMHISELGNLSYISATTIEALRRYDINVLVRIMGAYILSDPLIVGGGIWLEPNEYKQGQKYFGPYIYLDNRRIDFTWEYSTPKYDYFRYDWYRNGFVDKERVVWTEPFTDSVSGIRMMTATSAIHRDTQVVGVTTVDIGMDQLQKELRKIRVGETGYAFLLSEQGMYLGHPDDKKNFNQLITSEKDTYLRSLGYDILKEQDVELRKLRMDNIDYVASFAPVGSTGLKMVMLLPAEEIYGGLTNLLLIHITLFVLAVLGMWILFYFFVGRQVLAPLADLTESAGRIRDGDLSTRVRMHAGKEFMLLGNAFNSMAERIQNLLEFSQQQNLWLEKKVEERTCELKEKNEQLQTLAAVDPLTLLYNRSYFVELVEKELFSMRLTGKKACIIIMDIDHFKDINDNFGHPAGDSTLVDIALIIRQALRNADIPARLGGDEFIFLLPETILSGGISVAEKLRVAVAEHEFTSRPVSGITASFGVAELDVQEDNALDHSYMRADSAVYLAKKNGRNRVEVYESINI